MVKRLGSRERVSPMRESRNRYCEGRPTRTTCFIAGYIFACHGLRRGEEAWRKAPPPPSPLPTLPESDKKTLITLSYVTFLYLCATKVSRTHLFQANHFALRWVSGRVGWWVGWLLDVRAVGWQWVVIWWLGSSSCCCCCQSGIVIAAAVVICCNFAVFFSPRLLSFQPVCLGFYRRDTEQN